MNAVNLRAAKATLSAVVEAAERGHATTITKHGRPAAVVVSIEQAEKLELENKPSFLEMLMAIPHEIEFERDRTPMRDLDL